MNRRRPVVALLVTGMLAACAGDASSPSGAISVPPSVVGNPCDEINAPPGSLLMVYDNLERYPQFYAEENRVDRWHLNARGADLFSRQLARDFLRALDSPDR